MRVTDFKKELAWVVLLALLALTACTTPAPLGVDVNGEHYSPPYRVTFVNRSGASLEVLPSSHGRSTGAPAVLVLPGASFEAALQLRRITVGTGSSILGAQVVDSPYFEHAMADKAQVRFFQAEERMGLFDLQHPSWFGAADQRSASPVPLLVPIDSLSLTPWFPRGPHGPAAIPD